MSRVTQVYWTHLFSSSLSQPQDGDRDGDLPVNTWVRETEGVLQKHFCHWHVWSLFGSHRPRTNPLIPPISISNYQHSLLVKPPRYFQTLLITLQVHPSTSPNLNHHYPSSRLTQWPLYCLPGFTFDYYNPFPIQLLMSLLKHINQMTSHCA